MKELHFSDKFRIISALVFLLLLAPSLSSLTVEKGRIRLELHEDNGMFSLSYLEDLKKDSYVSLFFDRDPRTSSLGLLLDNKVLTLGPNSRFEQTAEKTVDGARYIWMSSGLRITETFTFIKSRPNGLVDGVQIEVQVRNDGRSSANTGVHLLIDTVLGENQDAHFTTSDGRKLRRETGYTSGMPQYWISPTKSDSFEGMQGTLTGAGITQPDKVIFANWKRLDDKVWNFEVQKGRNFNLPPYSINDSAVCHFYGPENLSSGESFKITTALGAATGGIFSAQQKPEKSDASKSKKTGSEKKSEDTSLENIRKSVSEPSGEEKSLEEKLLLVNDVISDIDSLLANPEEISDEKMELIEEALSRIEE